MKNGNIKWITVERVLPILVIIVGGIIAFTTLQVRVNAMEDKGVALRKDYEETKLRQDMLLIKQAELIQSFENKLTRLETVVEYMENGNCD